MEKREATEPVGEDEDVAKERTAEMALRVEGINNAQLNKNVRIYLQAIDEQEADGSDRYRQLVEEAISKALRALGYYDSRVNFRVEVRSAPPEKKFLLTDIKENILVDGTLKTLGYGDDDTGAFIVNENAKSLQLLVANVSIGEPVKLEETDVRVEGQAQTDPEFEKLAQTLPSKGTQLNHETYEDYKSSLQKLALQRGYFDAEMAVHRLEVMPSTHQAWWRIQFDSGERYRYGEIKFVDSQIREDYLRNMLVIHRGEEYSLSDVSQTTSDFSSSGWFSSVLVQPHLQEQTKLVDFDILLYPRKKNTVELGVGYASDVGPRLQIGWNKPWINNRGHSFRSSFYISAPKQTIEATYKMPLLANPLNYYYEFSTGIENEDDNDTKSLAATTAALRYWNHPTGWQYSLGMRARYDKFTQADVEDRVFLLYPTASLTRTRLQGGMFPSWGDSQRITVDLGRKLWLSDVDFFSIRASTAWIRTIAYNHRFITRFEIGYLHTPDIHKIPPALRFFAGGDRSVRGYGYKKISPKDINGKLIGGSRLATGTLEYQYQVYPSWWAATFVDSGLAANSYSTDELRYGIGVGIRWASPVGAIKFDIATPVRDKDNSKNIQFYIGLGTEI
ncbi:MAG TPA: hypothetical protein DD638_01560 [Pasteurellaceae bacterium]|nr:hypothetical protein [Pasteurellaceae bacterium]